MEELLNSFIGKKIDVSCGTGPTIRGKVTQIKSGVLYLVDEDEKSAFVVIDKIATVSECNDSSSRPGFIG
jgi:hypothetical protein